MLQKNFSIENCEGVIYHIQNCSQLQKLINYWKKSSIEKNNEKNPSSKACFLIQNVDSCIKAKNELMNAIQDKNAVIHNINNHENNIRKAIQNVDNKRKQVQEIEQNTFTDLDLLDLDVDIEEEKNIIFVENNIFYTTIIQTRNYASMLMFTIFMYYFIKNNFFE